MNDRSLILCLVLASQPLLVHAQQKGQYLIEAEVLNCPTGKTDVTSAQITTVDRTSSNTNAFIMVLAQADFEFGVGGQGTPAKLHLGAGDFNPSSLPKDLDLLSAPRIITIANQPATIKIAQEPPQYFEKQSDGSFQLRQAPATDWLGFQLNVTVKPDKTDTNKVTLDASLQVNWIQSREPVPNVTLGVGKPVITSRAVQTSVHLDLNRWCLISMPGTAGAPNRSMLFLLRVRRAQN